MDLYPSRDVDGVRWDRVRDVRGQPTKIQDIYELEWISTLLEMSTEFVGIEFEMTDDNPDIQDVYEFDWTSTLFDDFYYKAQFCRSGIPLLAVRRCRSRAHGRGGLQ